MHALVMVLASKGFAGVVLGGHTLTVVCVFAQALAATTDSVSMVLAIATLDSKDPIALSNLAHQSAPSMVHAVMVPAFAVLGGLVTIVP